MIIRLVQVIAHIGNVIIVVMNGLHLYSKEQKDTSVQNATNNLIHKKTSMTEF